MGYKNPKMAEVPTSRLECIIWSLGGDWEGNTDSQLQLVEQVFGDISATISYNCAAEIRFKFLNRHTHKFHTKGCYLCCYQ